MLPLLLIACGVLPYHRPPAPLTVGEPAVAAAPEPIPSIAPMLERVDRRLAATDSVDARDRLVELRDLLVSVQLADPKVQERVLRYAERALVIEDRAQPFSLAESPMLMASTLEAVVETVAVEPVDPLSGAQALLAAGKPLEALAALDGLPEGEGASDLRSRAIELWIRAEFERSELALQAARAQPQGPDRRAAVLLVREQLLAIRARFPGSPSAAEVGPRLQRVDTEFAKP